MKIDINECNEKYEIIYTDPPWSQKKGGLRKNRPNQGRELDYSTMSLNDIIEFHKMIANTISEDTHTVFMWTIEKYLKETLEFMEQLGYKRHINIHWDKQNGIAPAFTMRYCVEYLIWFYKPKMISIPKELRGKYRNVLTEPATKHSKKPIEAYELIENLYPNQKKIELFARNNREGWDCWGDQC